MPFEGIAWAAAASSASSGGSSTQFFYTTIIPLAILFAIFYFIIIRPQSKRQGDHEKMIKALRRNDEVVTSGGLIGRIVELGEKVVTVEIAQNVRVRVERPQIASLSAHGGAPKQGRKDKDGKSEKADKGD